MRNEKNPKAVLLNRLLETPKLIQSIEERLKLDDKIGINVGMEEGLILKSLCSQKHVDKVVEIGTQYGCSASWMALGLKRGAKLFCFESEPAHVLEAQKTFANPSFLECGVEVQVFAGKALERLHEIESKGPFNLIFIDANKSGYWDYFQWARENIAVGGMIVADNVYLFGTQFFEECPEQTPKNMWMAMRRMLEEAFKDSTLDSSIIPTGEGLLISVKKEN